MKKGIYLAVVISLFCSCQKQDVIYSCDNDTNTWVKHNLDNISAMSQDDFLSFRNDKNRQNAIYVALNPEQKKDLWLRKVESVLALSWSNKEKAHIESFFKIIETSPFLFDSSLAAQNEDEIDIISYKWIDYAHKELGWDREIYAIAMTLNPISRINSMLVVDESTTDAISIKSRSEGDFILACYCYTNSGIYDGTCSSGFSCVTGNCEKVRNCGFANASMCVGLCVKN